MNIVWFKRDIRATDHAPLHQAISEGPSVGLFIFEPEWLESDEFEPSHLHFVWQSLMSLQANLKKINVPLILKYGSAKSVFDEMLKTHTISAVFSHEETGLLWSFQRDIQLKEWFRAKSIRWREYRQWGVVRRLKTRDNWAAWREKIIERPLIPQKTQAPTVSPWREALGVDLLKQFPNTKPTIQNGSRAEADMCLDSFLTERGQEYFRSLSSPVTAFEQCSRISPYLSWGVLSMTEVHHELQKAKRRHSQNKLWKISLKQFESRLWWRCHFVQKLESEPDIEFYNFNRQFDGMRESEFDEAKFQAWCRGETGFPLIDACMRALLEHGWINFRMRAMLMSFATYQLWLHWKKPAIHLAKHFIDFEPGIHYSQAQMQSGVTGINAIRIYSPKKQQIEQDPDGIFVKQFVPELADVSAADLPEPHKMPPLLQMESGFRMGETYPHPIVDPEKSYDDAKKRIFEWRKQSIVKAESKKVYIKHGSRKHRHFPEQNRGEE